MSKLEQELGNLMSELSQEAYCATWVPETLEVCIKIYNGTMEKGTWFWTDEQRARLIKIVDELGYWVEMNMEAGPDFVKAS